MNSLLNGVQGPAPLASILKSGEFNGLLPDLLLRINIGIAVLDEDASVVAVDRAMRMIVHDADQLLTRRGRLFAACPDEDVRLQAAIKAAYQTMGCRPGQRAMPIWGTADHALVVSIYPFTVTDRTRGGGRAAIVMAVNTAPSVCLDDGFLRDAFQLTDAEALVAKRLVGGDTLSDIADSKGISINTARAQLKSVMQKLGVGRQSELVALLSRCDNALRLARPFRADLCPDRQLPQMASQS